MTHPLASARTRAREERGRLGGRSSDLLSRLVACLLQEHQIELVPVDKRNFLQGSRGEIVPAEGCLYYDRTLDPHADELIEVVAHEYGHIVLHHSRFVPTGGDLIRGSAFLNSGAPALSRYSPKSQEEAEASAFAAELICPAREIFGRWRLNTTISQATLATGYQVTSALVRQQLAEGLYEYLAADQDSQGEQKEEPATPEQEKAATASGIPVLVGLAGAGTSQNPNVLGALAMGKKDLVFGGQSIFNSQPNCEAILETLALKPDHAIPEPGYDCFKKRTHKKVCYVKFFLQGVRSALGRCANRPIAVI